MHLQASWHKHCWSNQVPLPTHDPHLYYKNNYTAYPVCK
jgi:hypothetical protein